MSFCLVIRKVGLQHATAFVLLVLCPRSLFLYFFVHICCLMLRYTGGLRLLDSRLLTQAAHKCVTWNVSAAHDGIVSDIAWSPFLTHTFASASHDGTVKVWDTRYGTEPVKVCTGHTNAVESLCWSRSHVEVLLSGGRGTFQSRICHDRVACQYCRSRLQFACLMLV